MAEVWVSTDEAEDVAGSIRHVLREARFVAEDPQAWKWVALGLHSALQGACVCHLIWSAPPLGAVTSRNAEEWIEYLEDSRTNPQARRPKTYLMALPDLLKAVRKPRSAGDRSNLAGIAISDSELSWLCNFHEQIRNQFVHFEPRGWSIEVSGIPEIAKFVSRVIQEILGVGYAFRRQDSDQREEMRQDLLKLASYEWPG